MKRHTALKPRSSPTIAAHTPSGSLQGLPKYLVLGHLPACKASMHHDIIAQIGYVVHQPPHPHEHNSLARAAAIK